MKSLCFITTLLFSIMATHAEAQPAFTKAELVASGLTCSMCSNSIFKALSKLSFVEHITPDVEHSSFLIVFREHTPVDIDAIQHKVKEAGFSVASLTLTLAFVDFTIRADEHVVLEGQTFHFMHVKPQTLNGETTIKVIDRDYVSSREYKQYTGYTTMPCYKTGKMEACCLKTGSSSQAGRIYHVTI